MPRYLCDHCKYDYGDACRRPERPNARRCPDFVPRDAVLWVPPAPGQSFQEFLATLPVVTHGDHPEIRQAMRQRLVRRLLAAAALAGALAVALLQWLR